MANHVPIPPQSAMALQLWIALVIIGILWGSLTAAISRPRASGGAGWWPLSGWPGLISYGAVAGLCFGAIIEAFRVAGVALSELSTLFLSLAWVVALSLVARIGPRAVSPTRPQLLAGIVIIFACWCLILGLEWLTRETYFSF